MCQPDLDFVAPEIQSSSACSPQSDMFSLGLLICAIYNNGRSPIESNFSSASYFKQLETVSQGIFVVCECNQLPPHTQWAVRALNKATVSATHYHALTITHTHTERRWDLKWRCVSHESEWRIWCHIKWPSFRANTSTERPNRRQQRWYIFYFNQWLCVKCDLWSSDRWIRKRRVQRWRFKASPVNQDKSVTWSLT